MASDSSPPRAPGDALFGLAKKVVLGAERRWRLGWRGSLAWRHRHDILRADPVPDLDDGAAEVHLLTSANDWLLALWGLYSFYRYSKERYRLCVHDDGSLPDDAEATLSRLFPGSRLIRAARARDEVLATLGAHPRCHLLRSSRPIAMKEFDFNHYLEAPIGVLFDSDLIFYARPDFVCDHLVKEGAAGNWVNRDVNPALSMTTEEIQAAFEFTVPERYNTGFGTWHRGSIRLDDLEEFLAEPKVLSHPWRFEQTLHALCSGRSSAHLLPSEYDIYWGPLRPEPVMRHYVGVIRDQMWSEGVDRLRRDLLG